MTKVLLIAPLVDIPTITSTKAVFNLLAYADTIRDLDIDFLSGIGANRAAYTLYTAFKKYDAVFYWGHGQPDKLMGTHLLWSIINAKNIRRTKGAPFDTMACKSLLELGIFAVETGTKAYIGTKDIYYAAYPEKERDYLDDWIDYTSIRQKALLQGATFAEAYSLFIKKVNYYINIYKEKLGYRNYDWYYKTAIHNRDNTLLIGDGNARIV